MAQKLRTELQLTASDKTQAPLERMRRNVDRARKAMDEMREEQERNKRSIQGLIQALDWEAKTAGKTRLEIDLLKAAQMGATRADMDAIRAKHANIVANEAMGRSTRYAHANLRMLRGGVGQMGHQLQDIAVQLQMGTHGLVVFGQQGGQILSLFGPGGAVIGAFAAIGAAIAMAFIPKMKQATQSIEELGDELISTAGEMGDLEGATRDWAMLANAIKLQGLSDTLLDQRAEIDETFEKIQKLNSVLESLYATGEQEGEEGLIAKYSKDLDAAQREMQKLGVAAQLTEAKIANTANAMDEIENGKTGGGGDDEHFLGGDDFEAGGGTALFEGLEAEKVFMGAYYDSLEAMRQEDLDRRQAYADMQGEVEAGRLEMLEARAAEEEAIRAKTSQLTQTAMDQMASSLQANVAIMSQAFGEGTAIGKAFMALQQAMAVASVIMNAHKTAMGIEAAYAEMAALTANPALAEVGAARGKVALAMGYAAAGAIAGQALASFEGGGYTGNGARAGGLDGKGGYMAMLHPKETVIDHTRAGGQSGGAAVVHVNFSIMANDTRDFDRLLQSRRGLIHNIVSKAVRDEGKQL